MYCCTITTSTMRVPPCPAARHLIVGWLIVKHCSTLQRASHGRAQQGTPGCCRQPLQCSHCSAGSHYVYSCLPCGLPNCKDGALPAATSWRRRERQRMPTASSSPRPPSSVCLPWRPAAWPPPSGGQRPLDPGAPASPAAAAAMAEEGRTGRTVAGEGRAGEGWQGMARVCGWAFVHWRAELN